MLRCSLHIFKRYNRVSGGIGRHAGLRSLCHYGVGVRVPPHAPLEGIRLDEDPVLKTGRAKLLWVRVPHPPPFATVAQWQSTALVKRGLRVQIPSVAPHGDVAQLGEHLPCTQKVAGSSPVVSTIIRGVAQSGSASALGAEGRRFESCHPDHH